MTASGPHPFDPINPAEIVLATKLVEAAFPGVKLRYKKIDIQEPIKSEVIPYIEAERLGKPLPPKPTRLLQVLFHRLDTGAFLKALLNAGTRSIVFAKELPKDVQVCFRRYTSPCRLSLAADWSPRPRPLWTPTSWRRSSDCA